MTQVGIRTGSEYLKSLHDGRNVWVIGEGRVEDLATHPATAGITSEFVKWYDRHHDPEWQERLLQPANGEGVRVPWVLTKPMSRDDLLSLGRVFDALLFQSAGNMTHTPAYGNLMCLSLVETVRTANHSAEEVANILRYRETLTRDGRFLTFTGGGPPIGVRMRPNPDERTGVRVVKETDRGLVISGKIGMHTSPAFAHDVFMGGAAGLSHRGEPMVSVIPINSPGLTVIARKIAPRHKNPFISPLSHRFDELDGSIWFDNVLVPWERLFYAPAGRTLSKGGFALTAWHQLYCWLTKVEFTLGLAFACADALGLKSNPATVEQLVSMVTDVQTVRSCVVAAEMDHDTDPFGEPIPSVLHLSSACISILQSRQRITEMLRSLAGSSLLMAPSDMDIADPEMGSHFEEAFGGGGYTALQRSALMQMAWDHVSSGLDGRENMFELHANGGMTAWRAHMRTEFNSYNDLANAVLEAMSIDMPVIDVNSIRDQPMVIRQRQISTPDASPAEHSSAGR